MNKPNPLATFSFNGKTFIHSEMVKHLKIAVPASFTPDQVCVDTTDRELTFNGCSQDDDIGAVAFYMYRGTYVVLAGMNKVKEAIAKGESVKGRMFTKHILAKCEPVVEVQEQLDPWGERYRQPDRPAPYREFNRSGGYQGNRPGIERRHVPGNYSFAGGRKDNDRY